MINENKEFNDRIYKFYQYLEQRLEQENQIEKEIIFNKTTKKDQIKYIKEKRQPIPASL